MRIKRPIILFSIILLSTVAAFAQALPVTSKDAYVRRQGETWVIGTGVVEMTLRVESQGLTTTSLRSKASQVEYVTSDSPSDEINLTVDGKPVSSGWSLISGEAHQLAQGEVQLDLVLRNTQLEITKHYVAYPGAGLIREWIDLRNVSQKSLQVDNPTFLQACVPGKAAEGWDLYYMTGGGPYKGSQLLKKETIGRDYKHDFDSQANNETAGYTAYTVFLPLIALHSASSQEGLAIGWDYMGHWTARAESHGDGPLRMSLEVSGFQKTLEPNATLETPHAFLSVFHGDLDAMGNSLLDWQYAYLWDLTNPDYFAKTRWAVDWPNPWIESGGTPSGDNWGRRLALDLRYVDLMRQSGTDILWDDAGWYDRWGDWNGPEWKLTTDYLRKHDMKLSLWWPTFMAHPLSGVAQQHPDWMVPGQTSLNQSVPETVDYQKKWLDQGIRSWGDFQWRFDAPAAISKNDTDILEADQNFRKVLEKFKRGHPGSGIDACWGGGRWISYDLVRFADSGEYTDGGVGPYTSYYTSLFIPPDKLHNVVDFDHTYYNAATDRTHLSLNPTWYRDPGDGVDVEFIRKDWDLYHYLVAQGVAGRWSHVFRPAIEKDDPIWYFQRMDRTQSKGVIITRHAKAGPEYYLIAKQIKKPEGRQDIYFDGGGAVTTDAAKVDTGIYQDPADGQPRFYGVSGAMYGSLNFKYQSGGAETSFVKSVTNFGSGRQVGEKIFGMAIQIGAEPVTITQLGMVAADFSAFNDGFNRGTYRITVMRAVDGKEMGSAELDMSAGVPDALGYKYAKLTNPLRLEGGAEAVVVKPRGLNSDQSYEVSCDKSDCHGKKSGGELMRDGIRLASVEPGELIYLNLPMHPGSGADKTPPESPSNVTKRVGTNMGTQGVELSWSAGKDDNWVSYYEVLRDGAALGKVAKGTFQFDYSGNAQQLVNAKYEVRTVDGDGNRSALVPAKLIAGDVETYRALGSFGVSRLSNSSEERRWSYEESRTDGHFTPLKWDTGGYEGRWTGSSTAQIGRMWMQPGTHTDVARGFVVPANSTIAIHGEIRKDPTARDGQTLGARILLNEQQIWPATGWQEIAAKYENPTMAQLDSIQVKAGDVVRFVVKHTDASAAEPVIWDPVIVVKRNP